MIYDFAIVGAGMAGASLAAALGDRATAILLEAEQQPGRHATGRSAAFWSETYGGPSVQPLTTASHAFLETGGFLAPRGCIHLADEEGRAALDAFSAQFEKSSIALASLGRPALEAAIPELEPGWDTGLWEPSCADIDVGGLHASYLAEARRAGTRLVTDAALLAAERVAGAWRLQTKSDLVAARILVNAAGAWADEVAVTAGVQPLGIQPYRRTVAQVRLDRPAPADLPLVMDALGRFYFKPDTGGRLWLSPHDETLSAPCDAAPEELDVALAIERLAQVVNWQVLLVEHKWAGLRSFAPDRLPVYGFDPIRPDFFWCAGQGGFGIQTAPAAARLCASLLLGGDHEFSTAGIDPAAYRPDRFIN